MRPDTEDYRQLFLNDVPLMDVRAPVEFERGAVPGATNLPLLDDEQRALIGTRYKDAGQDEAIRLGLELATPEIRKQRLRAWLAHSRAHPEGYLYCFRGGLRSRTTQQWMREAGVEYPLVKGGYKAMRQFLLEELEASLQAVPLVCVGGLTGSGKTRLLRQIPYHIDFEGLANHRGSAFGRDPLDRQPTVIDWENAVSVALLKHRQHNPGKPVFVEDEGRLIGRINIPECVYSAMLRAPRVILEVDIETRIRLIREDYIQHSWPAYQKAYPETAQQAFGEYVLDNLSRIQKRLGGERYRQVRDCFSAALTALFNRGEANLFDDGIRILLEAYYDPMYRYQMEKKNPQIIFSGSEADLLDWAINYRNAS